MADSIPCSVNMLTRNSAATLEEALGSLSPFAEIIIGDGRSTDATGAIAAQFGCRVVEQDPGYSDAAGRLIDYAGARSQLIALSSYDWIFYLDSDEILAPGAAMMIADVIATKESPEVGAYRLRATHIVGGTVIEDGTTSDYRETRLFRRSAVEGFSGFVNEHPELAAQYEIKDLDAVILKPLPPVRKLILKWARYLRVFALEAKAKGPEWTGRQLPQQRSAIRWLLRDWLRAARRRHPNRMPFRYEATRVLFVSGIYATLRLIHLSQRLRRNR